MSDLNPILEIDNELILFRQIFQIRNQMRTSLLIGQGGRITQHLVEFLAYRDGTFNDNIHEYTFGDFLNKCDFIPQNIRKFISICYEHRKKVISTSKYAKQFKEILLEFLEAFKGVLRWFQYIYEEVFYADMDFKELDTTIKDLKKKIKEIKEKRGYYEDDDYEFEHYVEEHPSEAIIIEHFDSKFNEFENRFDSLENGMYGRFDNIDQKLDEILDQIKKCINIIHDYQEDVKKQLENVTTTEDMDRIMLKFTGDCVEKIKEYTANYTTTELYKTEEYYLKQSFGDKAWKKLSPESKDFLTTAKFTYSRMKSSNIMDYSGVCLLVTKALELELSTRFAEDFLNCLNGKDLSEYPPALLSRNKKYPIKPKHCTLGTIVHLFGFIPESQQNNVSDDDREDYEKNLSITTHYSKNRFFKNFSDDDNIIRETLLKYGSYVEDIRVDYRNPAAHTNKLQKIDAEECFKFVLDSEKVLREMLCSFDE